MNTLAIETATAQGSIALASGKNPIQSMCIGERFEHSTTLAPKMRELLESCKIRPRDLDLVCVSKGPGSFTGLRVGIAYAKGLAMGLGIPVLGISTFEVLLAGFLHDSLAPFSPLPLGINQIALLLDAKKGEFFVQHWRRKASRWISQPPLVVENQGLNANIIVTGKSCVIVSPQLSKLRGLLEAPVSWDSKDRFPDAADLVSLGMAKFHRQRKGDTNLTPFYLRKTDAELLFKNKPRSVFRWERVS